MPLDIQTVINPYRPLRALVSKPNDVPCRMLRAPLSTKFPARTVTRRVLGRQGGNELLGFRSNVEVGRRSPIPRKARPSWWNTAGILATCPISTRLYLGERATLRPKEVL